MASESSELFKILVHGMTCETIKTKEFEIHFAEINSHVKYYKFNGIIIFQGVFNNSPEELPKRQKEIEICLKNGGFICYMHDDQGLSDNDMMHYPVAKYHIGIIPANTSPGNLRITRMHCKNDEFRNFIEVFGVAGMQFLERSVDARFFVESIPGQCATGMILEGNQYFVPTRLPDLGEVTEYFIDLAKSLVSSFKKTRLELPQWVDEIKSKKENQLVDKNKELEMEMANINIKLKMYKEFKKILSASDEHLVLAVMQVLKDGFGLNAKKVDDELKEDIQILESNTINVFVEVKGTNKGVKREHINQTDSHRERAGKAPNFPAVLIINTFNDARNFVEKNRDVAAEQVHHAFNSNVLITRTLDLLQLLEMIENKEISTMQVLELFKTKKGWLKVGKAIEVITQ